MNSINTNSAFKGKRFIGISMTSVVVVAFLLMGYLYFKFG